MFNQPNRNISTWVKWISIGLILIIISAIIYGIFLLKTIDNDKKTGYLAAKKDMINETEIETVNEITHFYGDSVYFIAFGTTDKNEKKIAFLKNKKGKADISVIDYDKALSKKEVLAKWKDNCNKCELIKLTPAMIDNEPLWELTYLENDNRYIIDYLTMKDAKRYEHYNFKHVFK